MSHRKTISEYLAERIIKNQMRVKFSHAHEDYLQEQLSNERNNEQHDTTDTSSKPIR